MDMIPDRAEFLRRAADEGMVPVRLELMADRYTPVSLFEALAGDDPSAFLLESVEGGERWARWSFIGWDPLFTMVSDQSGVQLEGTGPEVSEDDPLRALESVLAAYDVAGDPDLPPLHTGLVGYMAYDTVRYIEHLPDMPADDRGLPLMVWHAVGALAAFDRFAQKVVLVRNVVPGSNPGAAYDRAVAELHSAVARLATWHPSPPTGPIDAEAIPEPSSSIDKVSFMDAVSRTIGLIEEGEAFQVVPSIRFEVPLRVDPFQVYRALRLINPSPYLFFVRHRGVAVVGSSPELMVRVRDGRVFSRPIAGTRPRGATEADDLALEQELLADPKERAEHVMLIDLARNDVGRVAKFGSVAVDDLMVIERYSHVMHIVSGVSAKLRPDTGPVDVLRATFPHGTVSGAPKVRAMEIIDELEPVARGPYAGAVGYIDFSGNLDTAIALRTMVASGGTAWVQAGAGVVADSDPASEYDECVAKARAVLAAIGAAEHA